jgi:hypothetical protein
MSVVVSFEFLFRTRHSRTVRDILHARLLFQEAISPFREHQCQLVEDCSRSRTMVFFALLFLGLMIRFCFQAAT